MCQLHACSRVLYPSLSGPPCLPVLQKYEKNMKKGLLKDNTILLWDTRWFFPPDFEGGNWAGLRDPVGSARLHVHRKAAVQQAMLPAWGCAGCVWGAAGWAAGRAFLV